MWILPPALLMLLDQTQFTMIVILVMAAYTAGRLPLIILRWIEYYLDIIGVHLEKLQMHYIHHGRNNIGFNTICDYTKRVFEEVQQTTNYGIIAVASPIRPIQLSQPVLDITNQHHHNPTEIKALSKFADNLNQIITVLVLLGSYLVLGSAGVPLVTILSLYVLHGYTAPTLPVHRANNDVSQMKDGIYLVEKQIFGWNLTSSIGVCHNGVFHATYHGSGDIPLQVNGRSTTSVFASPQADITTWFGDPQFSKPKEDDELYVLVNRVGGQTTY